MNYIIYHSDTDGFASAFIYYLFRYKELNTFDDNNTQYCLTQYGKDYPFELFKITKNDNLFIFDFSYEEHEIIELCEYFSSVVIIDHHATSINKLKHLKSILSNFNFVYDEKHSACYLTWKYFFPENKPMKFVKYIQDRDIWTKALPNTYEINYFIMNLKFDFNIWYNTFITNKDCWDEYIKDGKILKRHIEKFVKIAIGTPYISKFEGYSCIMVNSSLYISEIGDYLCKNYDIDFAVIYHYKGNGDKIFCLRSRKDSIDVSKIAENFGGGGHKSASAFSIKKR